MSAILSMKLFDILASHVFLKQIFVILFIFFLEHATHKKYIYINI